MEHNPKAFPLLDADVSYRNDGMTLRDYFAAKAMQAMVSADMTAEWPEECAKRSYYYADQMLESRKKNNHNKT